MSRESELHVKLVEAAAAEVDARHGHLYSLSLLVDLPSAGQNRPIRIGGFIPDIFAIDAPETCRVIAEAKTPLDCETVRSRAQIAAFLRHLSLFPCGSFYLSVPLFYRTRAQGLVAAVVQETGALTVKTDVIAGL